MQGSELEPCNRCLVMLNAASYISVQDIKDNSFKPIEYHGGAGRPRELKAWYQQMRAEVPNATFRWDNIYDALTPVSTWHSDPVCPFHLIELRQMEWDWVHNPNDRRTRRY